MPPKTKSSKNVVKIATPLKNSISNLFNKIQERDSSLKECSFCKEKIKSCLLKDHLATKCVQRAISATVCQDDEIIFLGESNTPTKMNRKFKIDIKTETKISYKNEPIECVNISYIADEKEEVKNEIAKPITNVTLAEPAPKRRSISQLKSTETPLLADKKELTAEKLDEDDLLLQDYLNKSDQLLTEEAQTQEKASKPVLVEAAQKSNQIESADVTIPDESDYYLNNFTNAIQSVLAEETFACLLDTADYEVIEKFSNLKSNPRSGKYQI